MFFGLMSAGLLRSVLILSQNWVINCFFLFRIDEETEIRGLDIKKHGEPAYPTAAQGHGWDDEGHNVMSGKFWPSNLVTKN